MVLHHLIQHLFRLKQHLISMANDTARVLDTPVLPDRQHDNGQYAAGGDDHAIDQSFVSGCPHVNGKVLKKAFIIPSAALGYSSITRSRLSTICEKEKNWIRAAAFRPISASASRSVQALDKKRRHLSISPC